MIIFQVNSAREFHHLFIVDIPTYKEIKKEVVPLFKNPVTLDHRNASLPSMIFAFIDYILRNTTVHTRGIKITQNSEFHYFNFNNVRYRLDRVEKKSILRAETEDEDIPMTFMKTPRGST